MDFTLKQFIDDILNNSPTLCNYYFSHVQCGSPSGSSDSISINYLQYKRDGIVNPLLFESRDDFVYLYFSNITVFEKAYISSLFGLKLSNLLNELKLFDSNLIRKNIDSSFDFNIFIPEEHSVKIDKPTRLRVKFSMVAKRDINFGISIKNFNNSLFNLCFTNSGEELFSSTYYNDYIRKIYKIG